MDILFNYLIRELVCGIHLLSLVVEAQAFLSLLLINEFLSFILFLLISVTFHIMLRRYPSFLPFSFLGLFYSVIILLSFPHISQSLIWFVDRSEHVEKDKWEGNQERSLYFTCLQAP